MAYEVYGNLDLHLGQLKNTKFEQVTTLPTASASEYGRLVHLVPDDIVYQCQKQGDNYLWRSLQIKNVTVTGNGNVVTDVSYNGTDHTITITKGISAVEQETGKGLSTNDYTTTEKNKLAGIAAGAEVNQNAYANVKEEFIAMLNYGIIALIQCELGTESTEEIENGLAEKLYDKYAGQTKELMMKKNHDYGEAWRDMRISSMTDVILMKIKRLKQIEDNQGKTVVSEGVEGSYSDIINYSIFCLIQLEEGKE